MTATNRPRSSNLVGADIATRMAAFDFSVIGQLLPNPDPLLKELGQDIRVYRNLARDPHVGACIRRRKSALKALQWGLNRSNAPARVEKSVRAMLDDLDMQRIIGQAATAVLYGYQPLELTWSGSAGGVWVTDIQAKPPEWFAFDPDACLRFRTRQDPFMGELLPDRKFILARQDADYRNPYGDADLALCYWPVLFKKGGLRFWVTFAEKFGGAFAVGKLPRGTSDAERSAMLAALEDLIQDAVATIPDDGSVELIELAGKSASGDLYERLAMYCRSEISIVLTGTNQTMEASSNRASAHAGMDVADSLRDADAEIVCAAVNQAIRWAVDQNYPGAAAPVFEMWDQRARDQLQAQRDKSNHEAGARFTNVYFQRAYGYQDGDLVQPNTPDQVAGNAAPAAFAEAAASANAADPTAADTAALTAAGAPALAGIVDRLQRLVADAPDMATLQDQLTAAYADLPTDDLVKVMGAAFALAQLKGMADAAEGV